MNTAFNRARFLDPRLFPAFLAAAEYQHFTQAAESTHMTQSGVSQHISKLEEQIGRPLFKRLGKRVVLTEAGSALRRHIQDQVVSINSFFDRLQSEEEGVSGQVSYAMPPSCLLSNHFIEILQRRRDFPELQLRIVTGSSEQILELVVRDEVDFAFVAGKHEHAAVTFDPYCEEECILVSTNEALMRAGDPEQIAREAVVAFPGSDVYYEMWLRHALAGSRIAASELRIAGEINSIHAAIMMVLAGMGSGVFPRHCVEQYLERGELFESRDPAGPVLHSMYIARMAGYQPTNRVQCVLDWFWEMISDARRVSTGVLMPSSPAA
jgi:LysR family transcriptional regulator, transcriptional activator of the cysJI operon